MTTEVLFDEELMRRYDREGPRYTSYPTAVQFHEGIGLSRYAEAAATSPGALAKAPLSLYVHIPFCRSPCFYCGCTKVVTRRMDQADAYLVRLAQEIALRSRYFDRAREIEQLHFGGGTPTFLTQDGLAGVIETLDRHFRLSRAEGRDYSIEIDPRTVDPQRLRSLAQLGFNRVSLGVQDYDPQVQRAINRVQPVESVTRLVVAARELGFRSLNFDLIYGLPRQTPDTFAATLATVIAQRPDRLAVYGYAHMPQAFKAQRQIEPEDLPGAALRLALLKQAIDTLTAAGYAYIGMDHFALPADSLAQARENGTMHRTFQGYTTHASRDLVGLGVSAIGQVGGLYVQNQKTISPYSAMLDANRLPLHRGVSMSDDDVLRGDVIQQIMCHGAVDVESVERRFAVDFDAYFADELERLGTLVSDGLVERDGRRIALTPRGHLLMRNVAMVFDAYKNAGAGAPRLSRVI
ncbi:MAG TPA: oxygen-independent coproporphyrinogen III oxidase [Steroidobacteraceae bacterium]|nr:oxygen-independent coproporphyrinogen III oxidase [Steroidobacteraceae bacterium]